MVGKELVILLFMRGATYLDLDHMYIFKYLVWSVLRLTTVFVLISAHAPISAHPGHF